MIVVLEGSAPCTHYNLTCLLSRLKVPVSVPAKLANPKLLRFLQIFLEELDFNYFKTLRNFCTPRKLFVCGLIVTNQFVSIALSSSGYIIVITVRPCTEYVWMVHRESYEHSLTIETPHFG